MESDTFERVCYDCFATIAGFEPSSDQEAEGFDRAAKGIDRACQAFEARNEAEILTLVCGETEHGFSSYRCTTCDSSLAGDRYDLDFIYVIKAEALAC